MKIGAQLFTVRDFCGNLDSFSETLKKIANIGYKYVQISGTCNYEADWLKEELKKAGLVAVLTHRPEDELINQTDLVIDNHKKLNCKYPGLGWYSFNETGIDEFVSKYKPVTQKLKDNDMLFMYHNHDQEFIHVNGRPIIELLSEAFSSNELGFTLDTFWVQAGGADPVYWINKLSGRLPCLHLKDMYYGRKMYPVGSGNMNFEAILKACENAKSDYLLVEQDDCNGEDPFECLKKSYEYLRSTGLE